MIPALIHDTLRGHHMLRPLPEIASDTDLLDDLRMDSLDFVMLAVELEMRLGIDVPDRVALAWRTVGDVERWALATGRVG